MPNPPLSARVHATATPPIPTARAWAARYDGAAGPMLDLTQAVPGYPPHPQILARLAEAAGSAAAASYGPIDGDPAFREAVAEDVSRFYGTSFHAADVAITAGCNLAFTMAITVLAGTGDEVLLPTPWYFNHRMALELLGIRTLPFATHAENGFIPDPARLEEALTPHTRAVVLVTPNNPTGAVTPPATIAAIAEICRRRGVWLVLDETYRDFLPADAGAPHRLFSDRGWQDNVVQLYSFSKSYCVPGHRVGAVLGGGAFRAELLKVMDSLQICAPRAAQTALSWAIPGLVEWRNANRALMQARANAFQHGMRVAPGWTIEAIGTYFAYLRIPDSLGDALSAAERLAAQHGVLTLPGPFFGPGQERHLRLAFANAPEPALAILPDRLNALQRANA
ncbi:aminotransferase [Teichococcus oryzae]|uniref:aspartate transaminase n=1 Tax=Teichococcus oryzae TaxID=1608942 RepID=A0A5B2TLS9_9PROT|nr:aminotransferase [Pseudoroseomonas oryzae]KAA2215336.1 aminotransferase [Pseudoroseomonas oryzae]